MLLPVARPAIVAGAALVLMETINDIGATEYLGVRTLTVSVYSTWLNRGSLEGGAQIALLMLALVVLLLAAESRARHRQRFHSAARHAHEGAAAARPARRGLAPHRRRWRRSACPCFAASASRSSCSAATRSPARPVRRAGTGRCLRQQPADGRDCTAMLTVALALFLINAVRLSRSHARCGRPSGSPRSATPCPAASSDSACCSCWRASTMTSTRFSRDWFGYSTGLLVTGSAAAVVLACTIRFLALAEGAVRSGHGEAAAESRRGGAQPRPHAAQKCAASVLLPLLEARRS